MLYFRAASAGPGPPCCSVLCSAPAFLCAWKGSPSLGVCFPAELSSPAGSWVVWVLPAGGHVVTAVPTRSSGQPEPPRNREEAPMGWQPPVSGGGRTRPPHSSTFIFSRGLLELQNVHRLGVGGFSISFSLPHSSSMSPP